MDCRATPAHKWRVKVGLKQYDVILTKRTIGADKNNESFEGENMQTQCNVLNYRNELYFYVYKVAIPINGNGQSDRNIDNEIKWEKPIEQELYCNFFRIDPEKEDFDIFRAINEIFRHIKQSTKKTLINKLSAKLFGLEFESDNMIRSKALKNIVKELLPDYK